MKIELYLKNETDEIQLNNVTHVSYSDDNNEVTFYHKRIKMTVKIKDIEGMVVR